MTLRKSMDMVGAAGLVGFSLMLAFNQLVIKFTNTGVAPVFGAGVRSAIGVGVLVLWMVARRYSLAGMADSVRGGLLLGAFFSAEFLMLFLALDLTTVSRASILLYSMPVWLTLLAHVLLPGERLTLPRLVGLGCAMAGVALALHDPSSRAAGDWRGDLLAFGASFCWAGIALTLRLSRASDLPPEGQLLWQLGVSAVVLCAVAPLFGPVLREPGVEHLLGLGFQGIAVASLGFLFWLALMKRYRASDVAAFSFLTPVLAVAMGWLFLDEPLGPAFIGAILLVAVGIVLINRR